MAPKGSGSSLPAPLLHTSLAATIFACVTSFWSIYLHLKGYRRPGLQRLVVRIMLMIPIYAIASLVSLHSVEAAFWIDAVRDLYEAFVIYTFFSLLVTYLGGERSLLILVHGRPSTPHPWPVGMFYHEMDLSDPYTFLGLKRGILQYVYVKPLLALVTMVLKYTENYSDGQLGFNTGYTYVSIVYNLSICLSLYCLAMFWVSIHHDVQPFRPTPKFLCVKGILFFSFWQGIGVSILVASGAIQHLGPYTDHEHMSLALGDVLICLEMPIFAIAHTYAFCRLSDYVDPSLHYVARLPFILALRDSVGVLDLVSDFRATWGGKGMTYRSFEPVEGGLHTLGRARERRIRAGLRYQGGGKSGKKYWLPVPKEEGILGFSQPNYGALGTTSPTGHHSHGIPTKGVYNKATGHGPHSLGFRSPPHPPASSSTQGDYFARSRQDGSASHGRHSPIEDDSDDDSVVSLSFSSIASSPSGTPSEGIQGQRQRQGSEEESQEALYAEARGYLHGDWSYRVIDVSKEDARRRMREEEDNVLAGFGRRGEGRRQGERWGRGLTRGVNDKDKNKSSERKIYGAFGGGDERLATDIYAPLPPSRSPSDLPMTSSAAPIRHGQSGPQASHSTETSESPPSPTFLPEDHPVRILWTKQKGKAKEVASHLLEAAHQIVPATELEFTPAVERTEPSWLKLPIGGGGGGSRSASPTNEKPLPSDAIDLVVEAEVDSSEEESWNKERKREAKESLRQAGWVDREREQGKIVMESEQSDGRVEAETTTEPPLLHISPPTSPPMFGGDAPINHDISPSNLLPHQTSPTRKSFRSGNSDAGSPWTDERGSENGSGHVRQGTDDERNPWA
ncbi:Predicted seven transmembrane receptor-rhodopsin family [Phaffia rhodozyma]|uniref:Predicted seven transmembrane receptor-rhodopsin family n=1 Tax=Phaffia rhodozyma TaxID=264483 RepID=A0A0F7SM48_PHARH|nr:Predicted seven transmembrane receptor-rhodopsin family [Phaffia rhodozyma]